MRKLLPTKLITTNDEYLCQEITCEKTNRPTVNPISTTHLAYQLLLLKQLMKHWVEGIFLQAFPLFNGCCRSFLLINVIAAPLEKLM